MRHQVLFFLSLIPLAVGKVAKLRFAKVLDTKDSVILWWDFNKPAEEITFELQVRTIGWVGFGLSPTGGMMGADIVIGGVMPNQTTYFTDCHGLGQFSPVFDTEQNYVLLSLSENATTTTMRFSRKFRTCDPFDVDITADTQRIIAAYGTSDSLGYHGPNHRFLASVQLLPETPVSEPPPQPSFIHDIKMTNFLVPSADTTYACAYLPLPQVSTKNHIYKFDATIQSGNEDLVHHILLYACPNSTNISIAPAPCTNNTDFYSCTQVLAAWAVGGQAFTFPRNVGISLGTDLDPKYVRLEIHYNNPKMQSGRTDSSGICLYYTPVVRPIDAAVLATGIAIENLVFIPPKADSFKLSSICKTEKFNEVAGETLPEMQVFAVLLHTHLTGRAVQIAQYRNGTQIGFVGRDMSYDFSLQETRHLPTLTPIKMGDELVVECTYNTMRRSNVTLGGLSTTDEMCFAFLYYYPRNIIGQCSSSIDYKGLSSALGFDVYSNPGALNFVSWTAENIGLAQKAAKETCQNITLVPFNGSSTLDSGFLHNITEPPVTPCNSSGSSSTTTTSSTKPYMASLGNRPKSAPPCYNEQSP